MQDIAITLDTDWAPDFVIESVAEQLRASRVCATWFITHHSPAIERLRDDSDLFELGIHPNFLPGSTQGTTPAEVLHHCMQLVPDATSMRTHSLFQSTPLLEQVMHQTPIGIDVSLFLPHVHGLSPFSYWWKGRKLVRIPYLWEDDFEMEQPSPCWQLETILAPGDSLNVFDFHPIHIYLNSHSIQPYTQLRQRVPSLATATPADTFDLIDTAPGTHTVFTELITTLAETRRSSRIRDIVDHWNKQHRSKEYNQ